MGGNADRVVPHLRVYREAGLVMMKFGEHGYGRSFRVAFSPQEARRIAGALNICAAMPSEIESVNFDVRGE